MFGLVSKKKYEALKRENEALKWYLKKDDLSKFSYKQLREILLNSSDIIKRVNKIMRDMDKAMRDHMY